MLSRAACQQHMHHLGLSAEARHLVATIRTSPPSRNVAGRAGNVCVRYPSRKMGHTIQAESHHVELAAIYLMGTREHFVTRSKVAIFISSRCSKTLIQEHQN